MTTSTPWDIREDARLGRRLHSVLGGARRRNRTDVYTRAYGYLRCNAFSNSSARCEASRVGHLPCRHIEGRCRSMQFWNTRPDTRNVFLRRIGYPKPTILVKLPDTWEQLLKLARQQVLHGVGMVEHIFLGDGSEVDASERGLSAINDREMLYVSTGETFTSVRVNPYIPPSTARQFRNEVRKAVLRESSCVPGRGVMFSVVNKHMAPLRELAMQRVASLDCLMRRFVSLCLGGYRNRFGVCVDAPDVLPPGLQAADNASSPTAIRLNWSSTEYHKVTWAKWGLMHLALFEASYALCVDADALLLRNPFEHVELSLLRGHALLIQARVKALRRPHISYISWPSACAVLMPVLLLRQEEMANCAIARGHMDYMCGAPCRMNSGVFFSSSPDLSREIMQRLYPIVFTQSTWVDQDIVMKGMAENLSYSSCRLPPAFAGHCSDKLGVRIPPPCELVTYHTTCLKSTSDKLAVAQAVLKEAAKCEPDVRGAHSVRIHQAGHCCRWPAQQVPFLAPEPIRANTARIGPLRRHRHIVRPHKNLSFGWCEQACLDQPDCRFFSYSLLKAETAARYREPFVNLLPEFGRPFCALCAHCDMLPGGTYSSYRIERVELAP